MEFTREEHEMLLTALWTFSITRFDHDPDQKAALEDLVTRLGGDLDATYFRPARGVPQRISGSR